MNKRLKTGVVFLFGVFLFTSCKTPCSDPNGIPAKLANFVVNKWQCQNPAQVQADVGLWFASKNLCTMPQHLEQGMIANFICPLLGDALRVYAITKVPANWQCDPSLIGNDAVSALIALCQLVPF